MDRKRVKVLGKTYVSETQYKVLSRLKAGPAPLDAIAETLGKETSSLMRELAELEAKGLVRKSEKVVKEAEPTEEALIYARRGLPELRLIKLLKDMGVNKGCSLKIDSLKEHAFKEGVLSEGELKIALLHLAKCGWCVIKGGVLEVRGEGVPKESVEVQGAIERLAARRGSFILEERLLNTLKRRKLVKIRERKQITVALSERGRELFTRGLLEPKKVVTKLTPEIILSRMWDKVSFKRYDLKVEVPSIYPARKHPYMEILDMMRDVLVAMGFEEVKGPHVELEFWNFDALFQAQDHPVRDMHDSYYVKGLGRGFIEDEELVNKVKAVHETGWVTGSRGWRYKWRFELALRLILRTHTTAVSAREIYKRGEGEYRLFSLDRVFRRETLDPTHSMEFYQLEGIIVSKDLSFKHLLGFFVEFSKLMGLGIPKFKPAYFPYTEPSVEGYIRHPKLGWIEVFPGGLFRPEVLFPLGVKNCNVAAWGIGVDRLAMAILGIDDIRHLFSKDISFLRETPLPLKSGGALRCLW